MTFNSNILQATYVILHLENKKGQATFSIWFLLPALLFFFCNFQYLSLNRWALGGGGFLTWGGTKENFKHMYFPASCLYTKIKYWHTKKYKNSKISFNDLFCVTQILSLECCIHCKITNWDPSYSLFCTKSAKKQKVHFTLRGQAVFQIDHILGLIDTCGQCLLNWRAQLSAPATENQHPSITSEGSRPVLVCFLT